MKGHEILVLVHMTRSDPPELLHVSSYTKEETQVSAEGSDVRTSLAGDPDDGQLLLWVILDKLRLVDGPNSQDSLDGRQTRK